MGAHRSEIDRIRIKENDLYVKKYKQNGSHQILDRNRYPGIPLTLDATLKVFVLFFAVAARPKPWHNDQYQCDKPQGDQGLHNNRKISYWFHIAEK